MSRLKKLIFVGNGLVFHGIDWYRTILGICTDLDIMFITDLTEAEGRRRLITPADRVVHLFSIDRFLFRNQSTSGNIWRNLVKLLALPIQVLRLRKVLRENPDAVYHAHTMYYMWMCWLAGVPFIGTPQGDEILIRPYRSRLYCFLTVRALRAAQHLIVDSANLRNGIRKLADRSAEVIQYGIDVATISNVVDPSMERTKISSIRALYPLYRIAEILESRNATTLRRPLWLFYPFWEDSYRKQIQAGLDSADHDLGRFDSKPEMYAFLNTVRLAVSIPSSDSSPRSVYEAIFCGCAVAVTANPFVDDLPDCMRSRVIVVDILDATWLEKAEAEAERITATAYFPSERALDIFDQERSMRAVADRYYRD